MKKYDEEAFIYRIANMYYRDNISQQEIAASEGVSRSQIARLLNIARTSGMVKIYVEPPKKDNVTQLQKSVCALLGLEKAIVLPINAEAYDDYSLCMRDVAALAAPVVQKLIKKSKKIGVGIGASLYNLSMYIKNDLETSPNNVYSKTFITLCNSFGNTSVFFQPAIITNNFAVQYNASVFLFLPLVR